MAIGLALWIAASAGPLSLVQAQRELNAEARVYFDKGNQRFARAMRVRGKRKRELLRQALQSYVESLRIVRSRNALFNAAVTLEKLGRYEESFAYWTEYLSIPGLGEEELAEGNERRDDLRDKVAVVAVESEPAGAQVHVDRLDLAAHGVTPVEIALEPGKHTIYMTLDGHRRSRVEVTAERGEKVHATAELEPEPVVVQVESTAGGALRIDGEQATLGSPVRVAPGRHTIRLDPQGGEPVEREIDIEPGSDPVTVALEPELRTPSGTLVVESNVAATVEVRGSIAGRGSEVRTEVAAGAHPIRVVALHHAPYEGRVQIRPGERTRVRVSLTESTEGERRFGRAPLWTGIATAGVALAAAGVGGWALKLKSDYDGLTDDCPDCDINAGQRKADRLDRANLATDVLLGTAAALGITTLVLGLMNEPLDQPSSTATVAVTPIRGGGAVLAELPLDAM